MIIYQQSAIILILIGLIIFNTPGSFAQEKEDSLFLPNIMSPAYVQGQGPVVLIDEAHYNVHVVEDEQVAQISRHRTLIHTGAVQKPSISQYGPVSTVKTATRLKVVKNWFKEVNRLAPVE
jgi:hypothetical protein